MGSRLNARLKFRKSRVVFSVFSLVFLISAAGSSYADPGLKRLRSPEPSDTPCGVYLASTVDDTVGRKVADLTKESIETYLRANPDFEPKLTYVSRNSNRPYATAEELRAALKSGDAKPVVSRPALFIVGPPLIGFNRSEAVNHAKDLIKELGIKDKLKVKVIRRPVKPNINSPAILRPAVLAMEWTSYWSQRVVYLFPFALGQDYQKPSRGEHNTMLTKLATANTVQQIILFSTMDPFSAVTTGAINYANSFATGRYRKIISNWFNRSLGLPDAAASAEKRNKALQWAAKWLDKGVGLADDVLRKAILTTFFTVEIYWFKKIMADPSLISEMASVGAWGEIAQAKWSAIFFSLLWRWFYHKAIHNWEKKKEEEGNMDGVRRTAARFELLGTLIATPAFLIAAATNTGWMINIAGMDIMQFGIPHAAMLGIGGFFSLFYFNILSMDKWRDRLDKVHEFVGGIANKFRLKKAVDKIEEVVRRPYPSGQYPFPEQEEEFVEREIKFDVRDYIEMDSSLEALFSQDDELIDLVLQDEALEHLVEKDPHFSELRDRLRSAHGE